MELFSGIELDLTGVATAFINSDLRLYPLYLVAAILICFLVYVRLKPGQPFLNWLFPREVYTHASNWVDLKLFATGRVLGLVGVFNSVAATSLTAFAVSTAFSGEAAGYSMLHPVLIGLLLVLANDFGVYWTHRLHHEMPALWPFHSVHHSAEIMTPMTAYRKHPVYDVFSTIIRTAMYGILQGLLIAFFIGKVEIAVIAGTNAFYFLFNLLGSNIRHSHVWLSYGRVLEHVLISPAQHQIHHSLATRHWNRNYGEVFAIWDWMFGSLYVPNHYEEIKYGIEGRIGEDQPHKTLTDALVVPMMESWEVLKPSATPGSHDANAQVRGKSDV